MKTPAPTEPTVEICILAGGLSQRMGCDKARLQLGKRTMLGQIRLRARQTGLPMRTIRRDLVPRCGPLGGIYTALKTTRAPAVLFLACDMPFISAELMRRLLNDFSGAKLARFTVAAGSVGFPFVLRPGALEVVAAQIGRKQFSLQKLAVALAADVFRPPRQLAEALRNVNTPEELARAQELWSPEN